MSEVTIKSSIGKLELVYYHSRTISALAVIIVNTDVNEEIKYTKAINVVFNSFVENDFSVLKFNFRKDKTNIKDYDVDTVNTLDLIAAIDWLHNKNIDCKGFWLVGFDIGAYYGLQTVMRRPEIDNYMLFSPNVRKNDLSFVVPCSSSGVLVRASEDLRFLEEDCISLQDKLTTKTESKIKYFTIYNTDRTFEEELDQLKIETMNYIKQKISEGDSIFYSQIGTKKRRRKKKHQDSDEEKIVYLNPVKELDFNNI